MHVNMRLSKHMTVKTMRQDADKIPIIRKMISDSVDIQALLRSL